MLYQNRLLLQSAVQVATMTFYCNTSCQHPNRPQHFTAVQAMVESGKLGLCRNPGQATGCQSQRTQCRASGMPHMCICGGAIGTVPTHNMPCFSKAHIIWLPQCPYHTAAEQNTLVASRLSTVPSRSNAANMQKLCIHSTCPQ